MLTIQHAGKAKSQHVVQTAQTEAQSSTMLVTCRETKAAAFQAAVQQQAEEAAHHVHAHPVPATLHRPAPLPAPTAEPMLTVPEPFP